MSERDARDIVTAIIGPVDRPWDTRVAVAREWATDAERPLLEQAAHLLGY